MKKNVVIIILIIIVLGMGSFLIYDKIIHKEINNNILNQNIKDDNTSISDVKVVDYINETYDKSSIKSQVEGHYRGCDMGDGTIYGTIKVNLPKLLGDGAEIKKINQLIVNDYNDILYLMNDQRLIDEINKADDQKRITSLITGSYDINYQYNKGNDFISILVKSNTSCLCMGGSIDSKSYYYDFKNNKILSNEDVINKYNISKEDIKTKIYSMENEENIYDYHIKNSIQDLESFDEMYAVYVENNKLTVVYSPYDFNISFEI